MSETPATEEKDKPSVTPVLIIGVPVAEVSRIVINSALPLEDTVTMLLRATEQARFDLTLAKLKARESRVIKPWK